MPQASYAHNRTSLFVKVIANLHCFIPNICEGQFLLEILLHYHQRVFHHYQSSFFFFDPQSRREISFSTSSWGVCEWIHLKCYLGFPSLLVPRKLPLFAGTFVSVTYFYKMYVSGVFYVDIITHVLYSLQATYMCRFIVKSC